jgi:iron(III) transport system ATP-binding protein
MTTSWQDIKSFCGTGAGRVFRDLGWRRKSRDSITGSPLPPALSCRSLSKSFGDFQALNSIDLEIQSGEVVALLGPSGCGKTTTLRLIAGFEQPDSGTILLEDEVISDKATCLPPNKRHIGMVFQDGALFPHLTVRDNLGFALDGIASKKHLIDEMLEKVQLTEFQNRLPYQLSGGQQQRVAIGRALISSPQLLMMDEPFSNLDSTLRYQIREEVRHIVREAGITTIFVTHDQQEAMYFGDTIAVMNQGAIEQFGTPEEIFHEPKSKFVAEFIGSVDFLPCKLSQEQLVSEVVTVNLQSNLSIINTILSSKEPPEFMSRPDCIEISPSDIGHGTIMSREFYGAFYMYLIKLHSGTILRSLMPHTSEYPPGQLVNLTLRDGHHLKTFVAGQLVEV